MEEHPNGLPEQQVRLLMRDIGKGLQSEKTKDYADSSTSF